MLKVIQLNTFYSEFHVIKDVSLQVEEGQFVAVFGANGHGKSTLLKTICGIIKPLSGKVVFQGVDITRLSTAKIVEMGLVYVAEVRNLFPEMTVLENLKLGAYNKRARPHIKKNSEFVYSLFPRLSERQNQLASTLSGGEAQMLAVGRGLMSSARLLAIDEPSLGLAPNLVAQMFDKIKEINRSGISILLVEQSITKVSKMADLIYIVEDGSIIFEGDSAAVLDSPYVSEIVVG